MSKDRFTVTTDVMGQHRKVEEVYLSDNDTKLNVNADVDVQTHNIVNVVDPTNPQDAATKNYVDNTTGLGDIVEDITPQLGGGLSTNGFNITMTGTETVDGRDLSVDGAKLDGIEAGATADQTAADIRVLGFFDVTNDGVGSGFDADLLDGNHASAFATAAQGALADSALQNVVEDTTPQLGGDLDCQGNDVSDVVLKDYAIAHTSASSSSGTLTLDYSTAQSFNVTLTENITTVTINNWPASGNYGEFVVEFTQDSTARTITYPAAVKWPGGAAHTMSSGNGAIDRVVLSTRNGGTTVFGEFQQDYS